MSFSLYHPTPTILFSQISLPKLDQAFHSQTIFYSKSPYSAPFHIPECKQMTSFCRRMLETRVLSARRHRRRRSLAESFGAIHFSLAAAFPALFEGGGCCCCFRAGKLPEIPASSWRNAAPSSLEASVN